MVNPALAWRLENRGRGSPGSPRRSSKNQALVRAVGTLVIGKLAVRDSFGYDFGGKIV